ncbi:hypothetical protein JB92DRAFT_2937093 [Gautieria morchelliformis]|nr:hypothetical protein JB92DRAFT_2937093 [Gautieria morchelliformis]
MGGLTLGFAPLLQAMLYDMGPALLVAHSTVQKGRGTNGTLVSYVLHEKHYISVDMGYWG